MCSLLVKVPLLMLYNLKLYFVFFLYFPLQIQAQVLIEPEIKNTLSERTVKLSPHIKTPLKSQHPSFKILDYKNFSQDVQKLYSKKSASLPMAVLGDFNADKVKDLVVLGRDKKHFKLLAFVSSNQKYKLITVARWTPQNFRKSFSHKGKLVRYLSFVPNKLVEKPPSFKADMFQIETYQGFTELFFYKNEKFESNTGQIQLKL